MPTIPLERGVYYELKSLVMAVQLVQAEAALVAMKLEAAQEKAHAKLPNGVDKKKNFVMDDATCSLVQE